MIARLTALISSSGLGKTDARPLSHHPSEVEVPVAGPTANSRDVIFFDFEGTSKRQLRPC